MKKATHQGQCQVCGRSQMLPKGLLSLHGYEVRWSQFLGTCWGARHQPFELSKDLIEEAIKRATERRVNLIKFVAELRSNKKPSTVWVHEYIGANSRNAYLSGNTYMWREIKVEDITAIGNDMTWPEYQQTTVAHMNREGRVHSAMYSEKLPQRLIKQNEAYAKHLDNGIVELATYISWQKDRIKGWAPHPEKLVKLDEKRSNTPKVHYHGGHFGVMCSDSAYGAQKLFNKTKDIAKVTCAKCIRDKALSDQRAEHRAAVAELAKCKGEAQ